VRALILLLPLSAGCFFGHDHGHGHGEGHEHKPLPEQITPENVESVLEQSLRRVGSSQVGDTVVLVPWRESVDGKPALLGIEKRTARGGPDGAWTRVRFSKLRKIVVSPPAQGGLKLWGLTFEGETVTGSGALQYGETSTPVSIVSADGEAVKALAASVELIRTTRKGPP